MTLLGLHPLDVAILLGYLIVIIWIGKRVGAQTRDRAEFFLAGRRLGKFYQFFLNFGTSTNADQAVAVLVVGAGRSHVLGRDGVEGLDLVGGGKFLEHPCERQW